MDGYCAFASSLGSFRIFGVMFSSEYLGAAMTIGFDFIAIIVRVDAINRKFPGGLTACLDYWHDRDMDVWHDGNLLYGGGTMSGRGVPDLIRSCQIHGIETHLEEDEKIVEWIDACVCEILSSFSTRACSWLRGNSDDVYLARTEPEDMVYDPKWLREERAKEAEITATSANRSLGVYLGHGVNSVLPCLRDLQGNPILLRSTD